jgi:hypothetical protein
MYVSEILQDKIMAAIKSLPTPEGPGKVSIGFDFNYGTKGILNTVNVVPGGVREEWQISIANGK